MMPLTVHMVDVFGAGPLVRVRSAAAASAAFGAALVAWRAPPPPPPATKGLPAPPAAAGDALGDGGGGGAACALLGEAGEELLWRLLRWRPEDRASMRDALGSRFLAEGS